MATIMAALYFLSVSFQAGSAPEEWMINVLSIMMIITLFIAYSAMAEFLIRNWTTLKRLFR